MIKSLRWLSRTTVFLLVLLAGPALIAACSTQSGQSWRDADRSSAGIAPLPGQTEEAIVQVYGARAYNWRGNFAVHTWIATKARGASTYVVHDVTGWGYKAVRSRPGEPDTAWYGNPPMLLADLRGEKADAAIINIRTAIDAYPFANEYKAWPGPNSNTFVAWVIRQVPELNVALPNTAIGKDYLADGVFAKAPSGSGYQFSLNGYFGLMASIREGVELNILGLNMGIDPLALAVKLPGIGHIGLRDPWMDRSTWHKAPVMEQVSDAN